MRVLKREQASPAHGAVGQPRPGHACCGHGGAASVLRKPTDLEPGRRCVRNEPGRRCVRNEPGADGVGRMVMPEMGANAVACSIVELRPYTDQDAVPTRRVFESAVRISAPADYTSEQIEAWVSAGLDPSGSSAWAAARAAAVTVVAVEDEQVVGSSDLVQASVLDMLYVDPCATGRGVGSALVSKIVSLARDGSAGALETYASLTARPLFCRFGFVLVEQLTPVVRGVAMRNFRMRLAL